MTPMLGIMASSRLVASTAYESIASATGTGSSGTITFSSIPQTYTSLQIRAIFKNSYTPSAGVGGPLTVTVNSTGGTAYANHYLDADGSTSTVSAGYSINTSAIEIGNGNGIIPTNNASLANMMGVMIIDIHDYTSTTRNKTFRTFAGVDTNASASKIVRLDSGVFVNTGAVTSLSFSPQGGYSWTTDTQFALYGIKGA